MAVAVVCGFAMGLYMVSLVFSPQKLSLYAYHKWIGVSVFAVGLLRMGWRVSHRPPAWGVAMPKWKQTAAFGVHAALYMLLLLVPVSGWLYSSAAGVPTVPFGLSFLQLPDAVARNAELALQLKLVHLGFAYTLGALVLFHCFAVLLHAVEGNGILQRMLPRSR